ncbi:MAG: asparagine synthase (glutamine-hydrolyzing) [Deltaproteobacteria bacterium]|nr:asparagine synthase (glutamine-hydrolyzing) [Deltaproteobacteria bacterium]
MCGIVGLIDLSNKYSHPNVIRRLAATLENRGPDGYGEYIDGSVAMAMRRLSVIDLEHGWQPLKSLGGQVVAFQNGEIYNYKTLRKDLEEAGFVFESNSDTEVLAHGYAQWGIEGLLERIDGMYAIAILDRKRRELHLARDRFGEKPLFYCYKEGYFAYASTLLPLAALPWVDTAIDMLSLDRYLALHYVPGDRTIFKGIRRVLPGERLKVLLDHPVPERHRYYSIPLARPGKVDDEELAVEIENAVVSRLVADVPVGVFLSGGLDSSIVAAIAAKHNPHIATFSMGFKSKSHDESIHAKYVARSINSTHHHFLFDSDNFKDLLPKVAAALDEPIGDQAMLPLYWLCREARQHVTVALSGEGADEVFAGYGYYSEFAQEKSFREKLSILLRRKTLRIGGHTRLVYNSVSVTPSGFPLLSDPGDRERLIGKSYPEMDSWEKDLFSMLNNTFDPLQRATLTDMVTWLPDDLLVKYDRMAMAHSLEGRAPFLQPRLVELGLNLPQHERMASGLSKIALRRVAKRWLPLDILERKKQGFVLPMANWLMQWFQDKGGVEAYFASREMPGVEMEKVMNLVQVDLKNGIHRERLVFALVLLFEWYKSFSGRLEELRKDCIAILQS